MTLPEIKEKEVVFKELETFIDRQIIEAYRDKTGFDDDDGNRNFFVHAPWELQTDLYLTEIERRYQAKGWRVQYSPDPREGDCLLLTSLLPTTLPALSHHVQVGDIIRYYASPQHEWTTDKLIGKRKTHTPEDIVRAEKARAHLESLDFVVVAAYTDPLDDAVVQRGDALDLWCVVAKNIEPTPQTQYVRFYQSAYGPQEVAGFKRLYDMPVVGKMRIDYTKED